jgi:multisubunit Na+/H+ antiporter MnhF subunit
MEDARSPYFEAAPPLAWMAGAAALADLIVNRIWIPSIGTVSSAATVSQLSQAGSFARNLSVVSALVALSFCLIAMSSRKSGLPFSARAGIASFGWVLVPIVTMMTLLPRGLTRPELVLALVGLSHALIFLLILAGIHWRSTLATGAALVLTLVASVSGVVSMIVRMVGERAYWEQTDRLSNALRWSGELAYLAVPVAIGFAVAIPLREARGKVVLLLSGLAAAVVAAGMSLWTAAVGRELPTLLYGAVRLDFLPDEHFILYAIPLGIGWAVTVAAMLSRDRIGRQMGAATLLLLSAGYAPRSPSTLIVTVLGVALLSRAGIALAHRRHRG